MGRGQHRGQIPSQLDGELALLRHQDNRVNQSTEHLRRFHACVFALERSREFLDLHPVELGHARVKQRRRLVGDFELRLELVPAIADGDQLVLDVSTADALHDRLDDFLASRFQSNQLALRGRETGAPLHSQPVHLLRELTAELLKEVLAHQLVFEGAEDAFFDFLPRNCQAVRASATTASTEASEVLARIHDEAGPALAAFRQAREEVTSVAGTD